MGRVAGCVRNPTNVLGIAVALHPLTEIVGPAVPSVMPDDYFHSGAGARYLRRAEAPWTDDSGAPGHGRCP